MPKPRNIIIFIAIVIIFGLIYIFVVKKPTDTSTPSLVSSGSSVALPQNAVSAGSDQGEANSAVAREFLTLLLNIKSIKLDSIIFSDKAFTGLHDSSIVLVPDGTEGRSNPFAPIGSDSVALPAASLTPTP